MYNINIICTYSYYDPHLRNKYHNKNEFDLDDVEEFEDLSELIYKTELLKVFEFDIKEIENDEINFNKKQIIELYNSLNKYEEFMVYVKKIKEKYSYTDLETSFITLFSYDYFFLTHKCIVDILKDGKIREENLRLLNNIVE